VTGSSHQLILASASPRRVELLRQLGCTFRVVPSRAEEIHSLQLTAWELARVNAYRKARAVAAEYPEALVLGADTLVCQGNTLFGKPADLPEARRMLARLQGRTHDVVTGVCLLRLRSYRRRIFAVTTKVRFRPLSSPQIDQYLASIDPLDKAGAYAIQEGGDQLVRECSGSYWNVVGLPLERLRAELELWEVL
jgi:septum formation protein